MARPINKKRDQRVYKLVSDGASFREAARAVRLKSQASAHRAFKRVEKNLVK